MFDPSTKPRVFAVAPGIDFPKAIINGLEDRIGANDPLSWAQTEVFVNTRRMQRRIRELFDQGPARLLPRVRLITDLANDPAAADLSLPTSPLKRRLELTQLVARLLEAEPELASKASLFDLSDGLAGLIDEMYGEDVLPQDILSLDVSDESGHWERALRFITITQDFFDSAHDQPDLEARQRLIIDRMVSEWEHTPPNHPIIIAGSTGSRGATAKLMAAVSKLPQGAVILPGFDFHSGQDVWDQMMHKDLPNQEDHPQFRFAKFLSELNLKAKNIQPWDNRSEPNKARNKFLSLALCPAPITDHWMRDGPKMANVIAPATKNITLVEADTPRNEALTIALGLRAAVENGQVAALITPDRMLTRQVTAALDKWGIVPDDSAGVPLQLTAAGRFLRHVASLIGQPVSAENLLIILKHPLCCAGSSLRGQHLLWARELEIELRRNGPPFPDQTDLKAWAQKSDDPALTDWVTWVSNCMLSLVSTSELSLTSHLAQHIELAEKMAAGPIDGNADILWSGDEGKQVRSLVEGLKSNAQFGGRLSVRDYVNLFGSILAKDEMRSTKAVHSNVLIWGTLEARVQGADLVILAGLNEGSWPETPSPDPWLNRKMRRDAGLLSPERRIGLSAHDFQQAASVENLWITRSIRSDEAETVPSRWLNRIINLLSGLNDQGGVDALKDMRKKGRKWLTQAKNLDRPQTTIPSAHRPSPRPPILSRPNRLSVTQIKTLVRDPYAIYAKHILRLEKIEPLSQTADFRQRGIALHKVMEEFIASGSLSSDDLLGIGQRIFEDFIPWPMMQRLWLSRLTAFSAGFLDQEKKRRETAEPKYFEHKGVLEIPSIGFSLSGVLDRIDIDLNGDAIIYDYKTGAIPTVKEQKTFDKQLFLQAAMVERGGFDDIPKTPVQAAAFLGINRDPKSVFAELENNAVGKIWEEFVKLITAYQSYEKGYTSRRAMAFGSDFSDYTQLSRFGEWDASDDAIGEDLT